MRRQTAALLTAVTATTVACGDAIGPQLAATDSCGQRDQSSLVAFADINLENRVRAELGLAVGEPMTCRQVGGLTSLSAGNAGISDLVGLQNLTGLQDLLMANNSISDLAPLSGLTSLEVIDLQGNDITSLAPLSGLDLRAASLTRNEITDLTPLASMARMELLAVDHNQISDLGPLSGMNNMLRLVLFGNPITDLSPLEDMIRLDLLDIGETPTPDLEPIRGLTSLTVLGLDGAGYTDIGPVEPLILLRVVVLDNNTDFADLQPLIDNRGFGTRSTLQARETRVDCADVKTLTDRGVTVISDCT